MIAKFLSTAATIGSLCVGLTLAMPAMASAQIAHGIAATVNDDVITTHDLRQRVLFLLITTGTSPDEAVLQRLQIQALQNLVDESLQMQEASKFDLTISDTEVEQSVERLAQSNGLTVAELAAQTSEFGMSLDTLRNQVRSEVAWQRIVNGRYGSRIRISDTQIDETLSRLSANASKPSYQVSEIFIEATPDIGGAPGALEGARAMIAQLQQGAPFVALARQFSSSPTAAQGGDVGWVTDGELREELNSVITTLEPGSVSDPIVVSDGVYVIAVRDTRINESDTLYRVKQLRMDPEEAGGQDAVNAAIAGLQAKDMTCDTFEDDVEDIAGSSTADMGEIKASEISDAILTPLSQTNIGELSNPIEVGELTMALLVCDRTVQGAGIPTRNQIEDRLIDQQLALQSRRYLRDLRRTATIESR